MGIDPTGLTARVGGAATSGSSLCCGAKLSATFSQAGLEIMLLTLGLWGVSAAAAVIWTLSAIGAVELGARPVAMVGAWRAGGPLLGAAGAAYLMMNFFVATYAYPPVTRYQDYAPGLAEVSMVLWAGFLAGAVSTLAHAHLRGRSAMIAP